MSVAVPARKSSTSAAAKPRAKLSIRDQVSSGGVVYRDNNGVTEAVLISVGIPPRWQLPKGLVDAGEKPEVTAVREAREEGGVDSELVRHIETIEYWFAGLDKGERVRFHKRVHFFLLRYTGGNTSDHDWEVNEARWVPIDEAVTKLAFDNERRVTETARQMIVSAS
ncbi:MAG TPA: NUDIX domain-containing protein [Gemmatimonadaceae bacterium]|jgi:8-oxo-dGTP pyrophosphatase MutT (NUDIX family)